MRGVCADDSQDALFVTVEGKPFDESNIGKRVTAFWFKAQQIKLSSTDVRKIASSATYGMGTSSKRGPFTNTWLIKRKRQITITK